MKGEKKRRKKGVESLGTERTSENLEATASFPVVTSSWRVISQSVSQHSRSPSLPFAFKEGEIFHQTSRKVDTTERWNWLD